MPTRELAESLLEVGKRLEFLKGCFPDTWYVSGSAASEEIDRLQAQWETVSLELSKRPDFLGAGQRVPAVVKEEFTSQDETYTCIRWKGKSYTLTPRQAQVVKILHDAYKRGMPDVRKDRILEELETRSSRLRDSFKNSPLWGTLIRRGERKGTYRLELSDPDV